MQGLIESTQVFRWQKLRLHIAPEGLLLETRSPLSESGEVEGFAAYENIAAALVEKRGRRATLVIDFHDATEPPWLLPNLPPAEAEWAADLIQRHIQAAERISDPMFTEPLPLAEVGTQALTLLGNQQEQLVDLVDFLLLQAIFHGASDVHLEPFREEVRVRYRINGMLHEVVQLPKHLHGPLLTRLKVVSKLSVFRHDLPQEGRMIARTGGRSVDLRVSSLPTIHGEKVVIRIFDPDRGLFNLDELGFSPQMQAEFERLLAMPQGVILLTGPSNSGKTTTLYAALRHLHATNKSLSSIVTVEDPVEYDLQVINQTQVNLAAGLTFARGLRTVLRQDPEVIMIGEIRDGETAEIAVRAGLTGHLILSTVHARSAPGVF
ncbi:MAG TPA: type II/IV secretion system protein, partial [Armatimonadetes bacterium]|nr:type II/IV secretion system protein [Armatimonadota bacterium]